MCHMVTRRLLAAGGYLTLLEILLWMFAARVKVVRQALAETLHVKQCSEKHTKPTLGENISGRQLIHATYSQSSKKSNVQ